VNEQNINHDFVHGKQFWRDLYIKAPLDIPVMYWPNFEF